MDRFFQLRNFIAYQWKAKTKYYLHSPFVFHLYLDVLENNPGSKLQPVTELRRQLRKDHSEVKTFQKNSHAFSSRPISDIERHVAIRKKYGKLLFSVVSHFQPNTILEIGTSIGLSSSYMALAKPTAKIISMDGAEEILGVAKKNHALLGIKNIELVPGNFDETLPSVLNRLAEVDLVYFDGNHTKEATLNYFQQCLAKAHEGSIFIFDDIYRDGEMHDAWLSIQPNKEVNLTIDLFQWGICFFKKDKLAKENFMLRY